MQLRIEHGRGRVRAVLRCPRTHARSRVPRPATERREDTIHVQSRGGQHQALKVPPPRGGTHTGAMTLALALALPSTSALPWFIVRGRASRLAAARGRCGAAPGRGTHPFSIAPLSL